MKKKILKAILLFGISLYAISFVSPKTTISFAAKKTTAKKTTKAKKQNKKSKKTKKVTITFSQSTDTIENGKKFKFKAKVKNAKSSNIIWKSSNTKIISINKKTGMATAKKAGKTTITATINKQLVRRTVTVSPSIQDLVNANDTYQNLKTGIITSIYSSAASNSVEKDSNTIYKEYSCLDENKNIVLYQTVEDSYFYYVTNGTRYKLDLNSQEVISEAFSENENPNNNFIHYSNMELVSAEIQPDTSYHLVYMADIASMTETEQASVGLDSGICVLDIIAEQKNLLVQSYKITNYGADGARATGVTGTFVYDEENELILPDAIQNIVGDTTRDNNETEITNPDTVSDTVS